MALLTNGNYDQVLELGRRLLTETAKMSMALSASPPYLFSIASTFAGELDKKQVSNNLRNQFQPHGIILSAAAAVAEVIEAGKRWTIIDADQMYLILRKNQMLDVYELTLVKGTDFEAVVSNDVKVHEIWFHDRPKAWAEKSGLGPLPQPRSTTSQLTLAIELTVHIDLQKLLAEVAGVPIVVDLTKVKEDSLLYGIRKIDFTAFVEINDHFEVQTLDVRKDPEVPDYAQVPCVVIDFNRNIQWPGVDVLIKEDELKKSEAVKVLIAAAKTRATLSFHDRDQAAAAAYQELLDSLKQSLVDALKGKAATEGQEAVKGKLAELSTWRLHDEEKANETEEEKAKEKNRGKNLGKSLIYADTSGKPPIKSLGVKTLDTSLVIGIDYLSKTGNMASFAVSTFRNSSEEFGVTVNNRWLLRGMIRPALVSKFKLTTGFSGDFYPGEHCILRRAVSGVPVGDGRTGTLNDLSAFVDGQSRVRIFLSFSTDLSPGITLHASLDLQIGFSATREVSGANQVLRITPRLLNPKTALTSKRVDVAWWIYVIGIATLNLLGLVIVGVIDGIVLELVAGGQLNESISKMGLDPSESAVPLPISLTNPKVTLNDPGASPMPTALGGPLFLLVGAAAHDLHIGAGAATLPEPLMVTFQIPDSADPGARLDGIGGPLAGTTEWALPIDDAIALVDAGHNLLVPIPVDQPVRVIKALRDGVPYLRTETDDLGINNLGNLPKRIPAISGILGPVSPG